MLRNVVFDFGQVLVRFDPEIIAGPDFPDPADRELACRVLFDRAVWNRLDTGEIDEEDALAEMLPRLPERLREPGKAVMRQWADRLPPVSGMWELVRDLKSKGFRLFLLSNISRTFPDHLDRFPILSELEGCVFSGKIGLVKPAPEIFTYLLETYGLDPAETLFVDDQPRNIAGAEALGIRGFLFDGNVPALSDYLTRAFQ